MTSTAELQRLISLSVADPRHEPDFLRALLTARLYVHLPLKPSSRALQLVCFTRPDGLTVIPVFTDEGKAAVAAQGAVRVGQVRGWDLFMSAPGATFMLDPNDVSTTLYPEEILALLSDGSAAMAPLAARPRPYDKGVRGATRLAAQGPCRRAALRARRALVSALGASAESRTRHEETDRAHRVVRGRGNRAGAGPRVATRSLRRFTAVGGTSAGSVRPSTY